MLRPPNERAYERILLIGGPGSGKTRSWLDIAKMAQKTGSDARFYCLDTDFAVDRMLMGAEYGDLTNVEATPIDSWQEFMATLDKYRAVIRPQDWLIVDMLSFAWEAVQTYYTEQIFGTDVGSFFLAARQANKDHEFEGWTDWKVINKLHQSMTAKLLRLQGHLLCTSPIDKVGDKDDPAVKQMFGRHSVKPRGQKHTGHLFHTVLIATQTKTDEWRLTTVKDRERTALEGEKVTRFSMSYLVRHAGWRP